MRGVLMFLIAVQLVPVMSLLTGCTHQELCYDHSHVVPLRVEFDWSESPGAEPGSMMFYLFPEDGRPLRYEFAGCSGGVVRVPAGTYSVLCHNSDTEGMEFRNEDSFTDFEVTTRTGRLMSSSAPRADGTGDERVAQAPDMLWSGSLGSLTLERGAGEQTVTLYPEKSVNVCKVNIRNVENLQYMESAVATVSSMSGGVYIGRGPGVLTDEPVTVPFSLNISHDKEMLSGSFRIFGHCPGETRKHMLMVYVVLVDGSKWFYTCDVTESFHEGSGEDGFIINVDGLPLPDPSTGGGGFRPSVDGWQDVSIDIKM